MLSAVSTSLKQIVAKMANSNSDRTTFGYRDNVLVVLSIEGAMVTTALVGLA